MGKHNNRSLVLSRGPMWLHLAIIFNVKNIRQVSPSVAYPISQLVHFGSHFGTVSLIMFMFNKNTYKYEIILNLRVKKCCFVSK